MKLTLRKAAAVGQEVRRQLSNQIRLATDTRTVNLRAISTVTTAEAVQAAEEDRSARLGKLETLQAISTKIRRAIAEGNIQFGVNEILHKLRETEDQLEVKTAFFVDTEARQRSIRRGNSYDSLEECELHLNTYRQSVEKGDERLRGSSEVTYKLPPIDSIQTEVKTLQRLVKTLKNEDLLRANLNEVEVAFTGDEEALLVELNVL